MRMSTYSNSPNEQCSMRMSSHSNSPNEQCLMRMSSYSNSPNVQCSMRMSARSNPPTSPQYALAPPGPAKCLDISTVRWDLFIHPIDHIIDTDYCSPTPADGLEDIPEDNSISLQHKTVPKFSKTSKEYCLRVSSAPSQWEQVRCY